MRILNSCLDNFRAVGDSAQSLHEDFKTQAQVDDKLPLRVALEESNPDPQNCEPESQRIIW